MTLDTSGFLLEGIRIAQSNNPFTYPPRTIVSDQTSFDSASGRAEYVVFASGQADDSSGIEIGDPSLKFSWTRNDSVSRVDYDSFARRWNTMPGGPPEVLGDLTNDPRIIAPVPVDSTESVYSIYIGSPTRLLSFNIEKVGSDAAFTNPSSGTVQIALDSGRLNFSNSDVDNPLYKGEKVRLCRQSFFDRNLKNGLIGNLPSSPGGSYFLFLNPIPAPGQIPRIRIGLQKYLSVSSVATEADLLVPTSGSAVFSLDTGRVIFSGQDISDNPGGMVFYDGVILGSSTLTRTSIGPMVSTNPGSSSSLIGMKDPDRYIFFYQPTSTPDGKSYSYFLTTIQDSSTGPISTLSGHITVDKLTGDVHVSPDDVAASSGAILYFVDTQCIIDRGVSIQFHRSSVNSFGFVKQPDFVEVHNVPSQVLQDGISHSIVTMTAMPVDDDSLFVRVEQGSGGGGSFSGNLNRVDDSTLSGPCYVLDSNLRAIKFADRKTSNIILEKPSSIVKIPDSAIFEDGLVITKNGTSTTPGVDYDFDPNTGLIEFVESVGESSLENRQISGSASTVAGFISSSPEFLPGDVNKFLLIRSGPNAGIYRIASYQSPSRVLVSPGFVSDSQVIAEFKPKAEIVADAFWTDLTHDFKKLKIEVFPPDGSKSRFLLTNEFSVIPGIGQVNLNTPAVPGQKYRITYTSLDSNDEGVTVTPTSRTEYAAFKIRQELATSSSGSLRVTFNPEGNTVLPENGITLSIDGITQDVNSYKFVPPNIISLGGPIGDEEVVVDYWISEASGGNTSFKLSKSPIDVDFPTITGLDTSDGIPKSVFNGDKRSILKVDGFVLVDNKDLFRIKDVRYDVPSDSTSVEFTTSPSTTFIGVPLKACSAFDDSSFIVESSIVNTVPKGTNNVTVRGNKPYKRGTIIVLDNDPYLVISSSYNQASDLTTATLSASAYRNYIIPSLSYSTRPVLDPSSEFSTRLPIHPDYPVTLIKSGSIQTVLRRGVDYDISDGGSMSLNTGLSFGDILYATYAGRTTQSAGTTLTCNYAYAISPNQSNGLSGQKLVLSYNLYSPDTFFFRVESVTSFIPEVLEEIKKGSNSSSGPNVASRVSLKAKDMGTASLFYEEQHQANVDVVIQRLLKFYNDLVNLYEDVLSNYDGRVVGGTNGRFRYDGNVSNPPRSSYSDITNDIDDKIKVGENISLSGFFTFVSTPIYSSMSDPNFLSRLFGTSATVACAINGNVGSSDIGKVIGSIGISNLTSVSGFTAAPGASTFVAGTGLTSIKVSKNGDPDSLIPAFAPGQKVQIHTLDGSKDVLSDVVSVTNNNDGSATLVINPGTNLKYGSVVRDVTVGDPKFYTPGRDLGVNMENGQIINFTLPSPFSALQNPPDGNEIVQTTVTYSYTSLFPRRIPALDGSTLTDSGRPSVPEVRYFSEIRAIDDELDALDRTSSAKVSVDLITVTDTGLSPSVGDIVLFATGPNAGYERTVSSVISPTSFQVSSVFPLPSSTEHLVCIVKHGQSVLSTVDKTLAVLNLNVRSIPLSGSIIGSLDSEILTFDGLCRSLGSTAYSGSATISSVNTISTLVNLAEVGVLRGYYVYVTSGISRGLYKVSSVSTVSLDIETSNYFAAFPSNGIVDIIIIKPWSFLGSKQFGRISEAFRLAISFYNETSLWKNSPSHSGIQARKNALQNRKIKINDLIKSMEIILSSEEKLYDMRYLWLQQRTDRSNGTLTKKSNAEKQRIENTSKLIADQQKLLVAETLII